VSSDRDTGTDGGMYADQLAGNVNVNETQIRRGGRLLDDMAAAQAIRAGDYAGAGRVQLGVVQDPVRSPERVDADDAADPVDPPTEEDERSSTRSRGGRR